jgi:hypothetical protein
MIKVFLLGFLFLLTSCSSIDYTYFTNAKNLFSRNDIKLSNSFIDNFRYSFIKVSYKKNDAIFVLSRVLEDGSYEWVGSNYEIIRTKGGTIIETIGLESDIKFYDSELPDFKNFKSSSHFIDLYDPDLIFEKLVFNHLSTELIEDNSIIEEIVIIRRSNNSIGWISKDTYIYRDGIIFKSIQAINPLRPNIEIEFYFKY